LKEKMKLSLPIHLQAVALEELNETPEFRDLQIIELRKAIEELPLESDKLTDTSDLNLIRFLRSKKFSIQNALLATIQWHHFYEKYMNVLTNITKEEIIQFSNFITVVRESGAKGRVILIMRPAKGIKMFTPELKKNNPRAMLRINFWIFEKLSFDPQVQVNGLVVINNFRDMTFFDQMAMSSMAPLGDQLATFQHFQILGMRFKAAYIFEQPPFMNWLWFFIKPFMSDKIKTRFFLCGHDYSVLSNAFTDINILPADLRNSSTLPVTSEPCTSADSNWIEEQLELEN